MGTTCTKVTVRPRVQSTLTIRATAATWKEQVVTQAAATTVTHANLKNTIKALIVVNGTPIVWAESGITRNTTTGVMTFPFEVTHLIFEYK